MDTGRYQRLVRKLIYLNSSRSRYQPFRSVLWVGSWINSWMNLIRSIWRPYIESWFLRYLKITLGKGLYFEKGKIIKRWNYTLIQMGLIDRRSATNYCTFCVGNLVIWRSKKQPVDRSSVEAKFHEIALGICEEMWILRLLMELNFNVDYQWKCFATI